MRMQVLFLLFCSLYALVTHPGYDGAPLNQYGAIVSESTTRIQNGIFELVVLDCQKEDGSSKKIKRNAFLIRYENAVGTIVICHGFKSNKYQNPFLRTLFPRGRYNILCFDFRAHGEMTKGQICTLGKDEAYEVIAAGNFIKNHPELKGLPVYAYGFSMGAVAAIEAQAKEQDLFKAMILDCPFDSSDNLVKRGLQKLQISLFGYTYAMPGRALLEKYAYHPYVQLYIRQLLKACARYDSGSIPLSISSFAPAQTAKRITVPVLLIHCKNDEKVPVSGIMELYTNLSSAYKIVWVTNGTHHFDSYFYNPERYTDIIYQFLDDAETGALYREKRNQVIKDDDY